MVENSSAGDAADSPGAGVGLDNLRRRLEICYGSAAGLRLAINAGMTSAELSIPAAAHVKTVR
jgi:LytS/YehU family sensor histidine kinase